MLHRLVNILTPLRNATRLWPVARVSTAFRTSSIFLQTKNNFIARSDAIYYNKQQSRRYMADASTIIPDEIEKFGKMAERWWDPTGMNTYRIYY